MDVASARTTGSVASIASYVQGITNNMATRRVTVYWPLRPWISLLVVQPNNVRLRVTFSFASKVDGSAEGDLHVGRLFRQKWLLCSQQTKETF